MHQNYSAPLDALADLRGPTFKERGGDGMKEIGKAKWKGGGRREGKGRKYKQFLPTSLFLLLETPKSSLES